MNFAFLVLLCAAIFAQTCVKGSGVSKCYFCQDSCQEPPKTVNCPSGGRCMANGVIYDSEHRIEQRTCMVANSTLVEKCAKLNETKDAFCYFCDTDLCNSKGF
ncbi:hypothetical protein TcasGA2_TC034067 [Tribolium castaneum]|uniref:Uncharacterized protein n=1 Tax=Tribolium castaneum TaxID=7070 RepID=A0A139WD44_TRICA|nr:PREDICTED: uncharacterized protein LOC103313962 [Tribolium castaneum]KYB25834.1 hypothetical protein TcasGA2_TC034067 [Tribolium castaneum]|eukprot:XP_008196824.1 PREDICTED: uncharacterized protein LOC103313962 [Tribolium castaneum]